MSGLNELRERFLTAVAGGEIGAVLDCYHDDAVLIAPEGRYEGKDYVEAYYRVQFAAFPDGRLEVAAAFENGDIAIGEWTFAGTHTGPVELPGGETIAPTGKGVTQRGCDVARVDDGRIREHRLYYDQLEVVAQIGESATAGR